MSRLLAPILLLMVVPLWAQFPTVDNETSQMKGTLQVSVVYANGNPAPARLEVELRQAGGMPMAMNMTDSAGTTEFEQLNAGYYTVKVSGNGVQPAESDQFAMEDGRDYQTITVVVKPTASGEPAEMMGSGSVALVDLNVPKKAAKEYGRASKEMASGNWDKAVEYLGKAIAIDPQYSAAYNDLGICYGRLRKWGKEREALLKAVRINDHCVPALVNLAHLEIRENQPAYATENLSKALKADPTNVDALSLLAQVDLMQQQYDLAISAAHKAHGFPHHYAIVHYTAASALVQENRVPEAMAELKLFLQEEPAGPRAEVVRKVLVEMQNGRVQTDAKGGVPPVGLPVAGVR